VSGIWARTLVYLGLREEPEDHIEWDVLASAETAASGTAAPEAPAEPAERPVRRPPSAEPAAVAGVRPIRTAPSTAPSDATGDRVAVVQLRTFDDIEAAGAAHRAGRPVLLDLTAAGRADGQRALDFLGGVLYATGGALRRLVRGVFLLLPDGVELSADERSRLARLGYGAGEDGR